MTRVFVAVLVLAFRALINSLVLILHEDVPLVVFMYLVFTRMPGEAYRK